MSKGPKQKKSPKEMAEDQQRFTMPDYSSSGEETRGRIEATNRQVSLPLKQNGEQGYDLQKLKGIHHRIIRLHLEGLSNKDIAQALGCTPQMVSYTINTDLAQEKIAVLNGEMDLAQLNAQRQARELAPVAVEVLQEIMLDRNNKATDRRLAANSVLDRGGLPKSRNVSVQQSHLSSGDIDDIKKIAKEQAREQGLVRDEGEVGVEEKGEEIVIEDN